MRLAHHAMTWEGWWKKRAMPWNLDTLLSEVKAAGYEGIELGGDEAKLGKPAELQKRLDDHGLSLAVFNASVTANPWPANTEDYRRSMTYAAALGIKTIMVCGGFFGYGRRTVFEADYKLFALNLTAASEFAAQHGQTIAYHPHLGCMVETAGEVARLLRYIPNLRLCVDTGHLIAAGTDPAALIREYGAKIIHVHLKDWNPEAQQFCELGQGKAGLNFPAILRALRDVSYAGWLSVERDNVQMEPMDSAKMSRQFLSSCLDQTSL